MKLSKDVRKTLNQYADNQFGICHYHMLTIEQLDELLDLAAYEEEPVTIEVQKEKPCRTKRFKFGRVVIEFSIVN